MKDYIVSARKYRPADFRSVVGQSHITTTLKNAISSNQIAQAFLFCGPRGVGKTTCARILAKTINCTDLTADTEACNECESCKSFNRSASFNVFELDAASNNSVEDVRELVRQVSIPPQTGKYKVYIIDEVHMLSSAAFNAFLKTLEEPPAYTKFILATTEKHKIIPTILSRCQIFDFHRIKTEDIVKQLSYVAEKEGIVCEEKALHIIAQKSDGGMRDSLSMFDQLVNFTFGEMTYAKVIENLNVLDYDYYFRTIDILLRSDFSSVLLLFEEVLQKGFEGSHFISGLSQHVRDLLVSKDPITLQLLDISEDLKQRYLSQAATCHPTFLLRVLDFANSCALEYKTSHNKRLCVELSVLKMANIMNKMQGPKPDATLTPPNPNGQKPTPPPSTPTPTEQPPAAASPEKKNDSPSQQALKDTSVSATNAPHIAEKETPPEVSETEQPAPITKPENAPPKPLKPALPSSNPYSIHIDRSSIAAQLPEEKDTDTQTDFDFENVEACWLSLCEHVSDLLYQQETGGGFPGKRAFRNISEGFLSSLTLSTLELGTEEHTVQIRFQNGIQEAAFNKHYRDILDFMREATENNSLKFSSVVNKYEKEELIYTSEEKYRYFVKKNPLISKLREEMDLTVDI